MPPAAKGRLVRKALAWSLGNDQLWALLRVGKRKTTRGKFHLLRQFPRQARAPAF